MQTNEWIFKIQQQLTILHFAFLRYDMTRFRVIKLNQAQCNRSLKQPDIKIWFKRTSYDATLCRSAWLHVKLAVQIGRCVFNKVKHIWQA